ncbi:hypothetical protein JOM56_008019 [Amanita muscaria]
MHVYGYLGQVNPLDIRESFWLFYLLKSIRSWELLATWNVPPEQVAIAEHGGGVAAAASRFASLLFSYTSKLPVSPPYIQDRTLPQALSVDDQGCGVEYYPEEGEANVRSKMEVLKGLDHPNIVGVEYYLHQHVNVHRNVKYSTENVLFWTKAVDSDIVTVVFGILTVNKCQVPSHS